MTTIIPFRRRDYQKPFIQWMLDGGKNALLIWHRRAGKDIVCWNYIIRAAVSEVGTYYYCLPTYSQAKKVIWDSREMMDFLPKKFITAQNSVEMKITLVNGSIIQLIGTDNYDAIRGTHPKGVVMSEFAFQNPQAWEVLSPIFIANNGWAIFNSTPNGKNHFYKLYQTVKDDPDWYVSKLGVYDTNSLIQTAIDRGDTEEQAREYQEKVLAKEKTRHRRNSADGEAFFQQEYHVSFSAGAVGAYYADLMGTAEDEGRVCELPKEEDKPIHIYMDIGRNDAYVLGFTQLNGRYIDFINCYAGTGKTDGHYIRYVKEYLDDNGYMLGSISVPHDSKQKRTVAEGSTYDNWRAAFGNKIRFIPMKTADVPTVQLGIQRVRSLFPSFRFDSRTCETLIDASFSYKKKYDEANDVFSNKPLHDWTSDYLDMVRYLGMCHKEKTPQKSDNPFAQHVKSRAINNTAFAPW